ncbi:zf-HC2 domain-containing protein [bacterium]|nr:zf-HC2 domain-containing protein [bacterium]
MNHPADLLSAYLDDELTAVEIPEIEAHLSDCEECTAELEEVSAARMVIRGLPLLDPPAWIGSSDVVPIGSARSRRAQRFTRWAAAAAASVVLLGGVVVVSDDPAAVVDIDTMSSQHVARVVVDPGISTIRGPVAGP